MKKISLSLLFSFALSAFTPSRAAAAYGSQVMLEDLAGRVEVWSPATAAWATAQKGQALEEGTSIRTQDSSQARLRFPDGSVIQLDNKTTFEMSLIGSKRTELNLLKGRLKAFVRGLFTSRMQVRTPTAVAAIRGTELSISADENRSEMSVQEGRMEVQDNSGKELVIGSEERVEIGKEGHGEPQLASLSDPEVKPAFNPYTLQRELVRDQVVEGLQGEFARELKKSEYQLGKSLTDVYGRRVRLESYITRTTPNEIKFVFLNFRKDRFDHGFMRQRFANPLPDRLSRLGGVFHEAFGVPGTKPSNWLTEMEMFASNTVDNYQRLAVFGDPIAVTFSNTFQTCTEAGCTATTIPSSFFMPQFMNYHVRIFGPGYNVIKERFEFTMDPDGNTIFDPISGVGGANWGFKAFTAGASGPLSGEVHPLTAALNLTTPLRRADFATPGDFPTFVSFEQPSGPGAMHMRFTRKYPDGKNFTEEFALIDNAGNPLRFPAFGPGGPGVAAAATEQPGYGDENREKQGGRKELNWEFRVKADEFQGRDIDLVIDPRIFNALDKGNNNPGCRAGSTTGCKH